MTNETGAASVPIACDMTDAPDTAEERMAEYGRLFARALTGRERTDATVRLRFRADDGVEAWVRDLAAREKACCPFLDFAVGTTDGEVWWDISVSDAVTNPRLAAASLDEYYYAPDTFADGVEGMKERLADRAITVTTNETGTVMEFSTGAG